MKRTILVFMLIGLTAGSSGAKTLGNESGVTAGAATISGVDAVLNIDAELTRIFSYLNTLYKLQAQASNPTDNSTYDIWLDTTVPASPAIKYYNGTTWETLVNPAAYSSGLTYADAMVGSSENCTLEKDGATKSVMVNASTRLPCTLQVGSNLLQVTSKVAYDFTAVAAGKYYVYATRNGSTTAFTLAYHTSQTGTDRYLGEVDLNASSTPVRVLSYNGTEHQHGLRQAAMGRTPDSAEATTYTQVTYPETLIGAGSAWGASTTDFTPTTAGYYEIVVNNVVYGVGGAAITEHCIKVVWNNVLGFHENCGRVGKASSFATITVPMYFNGTTDHFHVLAYATPASTVVGTNVYSSSVWARWIGPAQ